MSIADDLRAAARWIDDSCGEKSEIGDGLRAHAATIERVEKEARNLMRCSPRFRRQHGEWADALNGETK